MVNIKKWLTQKVFASHLNTLEDEARASFYSKEKELRGREKILAQEQDTLRENERTFEKKRANVTMTDFMREQMNGFNPKFLDQAIVTSNGDILSDPLVDAKLLDMTEEEFLGGINELSKSKSLAVLFEYIKRNQIIYSAIIGLNDTQINFGRATINGIALAREEITRLKKIYDERNAPPDKDFDKHGVM